MADSYTPWNKEIKMKKYSRLKSIFSISLLLFILAVFHLYAEMESGSGGEPWAFLKTGVGARAIGMGGAFVAISDDSTAVYWNPAGLGLLKKRSLTIMHALPYWNPTDMGTHQYFSLCYPTTSGNFGGSLNFFRIGDIEYTEEVFGGFEFLGKTDTDTEWALSFSYGLGLPDHSFNDGGEPKVFLGTTGRFMGQRLMGLSATGSGADLGIIMPIKIKNGLFETLKLGYILKYNSSRSWSENDEYIEPATMGWQLGASLGFNNIINLPSEKLKATLALSVIKTSENSPKAIAAGIELKILEVILARLGGQLKEYNNSLTFGLGFVFPYSQLDYALAFEKMATRHQMSLNINL